MAAGHVQVAADGPGKEVDAQSITSTETGTPTVYRQTITVGDPTTYGNIAKVDSLGRVNVYDPDVVNAAQTIGALNAVATATINSMGATAIQILSGNLVGTLTIEATTDGTNWLSVNAVIPVTGAQVSSIVNPAVGWQGRVNSGGYQQVRVRCSSYTSGSFQVVIVTTDSESITTLGESLPTGSNLIGAVTQEANPSVSGVSQTPLFASVSVSASGDNTIVAAVTGKTIRVLSIALVSAGAVSIFWRSGAAGTALSGAMPLVANSGYSLALPYGLLATASGAALVLNLSAAIGVYGHISYITV